MMILQTRMNQPSTNLFAFSYNDKNLEELKEDELENLQGGNPWLIAAAIATVIYYGNECSKEIQKGWDMYK